MLELDLKALVGKVLERKPESVGLCSAEGLKTRILRVAEALEEKGLRVYVFAEPVYGACDLKLYTKKSLDIDLLVHLGHSRMPYLEKENKDVMFFPLAYRIDLKRVNSLLGREAKARAYKKMVLCAPIQFTQYLKDLKRFLESKKIKAIIGEGGKRVSVPGQVLGCNYSSVTTIKEDYDSVLFFGDGLFHAIGLSLVQDKPVLVVNPLASEARLLDKEREMFLRKRYGAIALAKKAKTYGIIVSSKEGQERKEKALELKERIEAKGLKAFLFAVDTLKPEHFLGLDVGCLVVLACPRIAFEDYALYKKPVITFSEALTVLNDKETPYEFEEIE